LILYSTVSTSRPSGARVSAAYPPRCRLWPRRPRRGSIAVAGRARRCRAPRPRIGLAHLGHPRPQESHDPLTGEAFPHPLELCRPPFTSRHPDLPSRRPKDQNYASTVRGRHTLGEHARVRGVASPTSENTNSTKPAGVHQTERRKGLASPRRW
jgi:hypothetical protein